MAATLARDADLASSLIEEHIRDTSERAIKLL
jgi:GntR family carbon starvation induced transcriptional regulator